MLATITRASESAYLLIYPVAGLDPDDLVVSLRSELRLVHDYELTTCPRADRGQARTRLIQVTCGKRLTIYFDLDRFMVDSAELVQDDRRIAQATMTPQRANYRKARRIFRQSPELLNVLKLDRAPATIVVTAVSGTDTDLLKDKMRVKLATSTHSAPARCLALPHPVADAEST